MAESKGNAKYFNSGRITAPKLTKQQAAKIAKQQAAQEEIIYQDQRAKMLADRYPRPRVDKDELSPEALAELEAQREKYLEEFGWA